MLRGTLSDEDQSASAVSGMLNYVNERLGQVEGSERRRPPPAKYDGLPWGPVRAPTCVQLAVTYCSSACVDTTGNQESLRELEVPPFQSPPVSPPSPLLPIHMLTTGPAVMNAAYHGYRVFTTATRWIPSPHRIAMTAVSEVGITAGQLILQYRSAVAHIRVGWAHSRGSNGRN